MSKKKPDYTKFMRKPSPLELSPPRPDLDRLPRMRGSDAEDGIPWAEIIFEPEHVSQLERAAQVRGGGNPPQSAQIPMVPGKKSAGPPEPVLGYNRPVTVTDASLNYTVEENFSPQAFFSVGSPVAAAPPVAALIVIVFMVFFLLLE
ncbi:MAG TPA: hypothetical protein VK463_09150 [Desulfomonilaceae bacterium]|nr:hypothetical protein [Desulfomonilaceae bacterium]